MISFSTSSVLALWGFALLFVLTLSSTHRRNQRIIQAAAVLQMSHDTSDQMKRARDQAVDTLPFSCYLHHMVVHRLDAGCDAHLG